MNSTENVVQFVRSLTTQDRVQFGWKQALTGRWFAVALLPGMGSGLVFVSAASLTSISATQYQSGNWGTLLCLVQWVLSRVQPWCH